jgi:myo-inositol-1(or 4)-monophosphatase
VDTESEEAIIDTIRAACPDHHFLAEESLKEEVRDGYRWIIDPLDGTTNFIHGYPVFAVSIALESEGEVILGVVLDPLRDELFTAESGRGAFLNGRPIRVSGIQALEGALITTGFPFRQKSLLDPYLEAFRRIFLRVSGIRRAGSAALDLAHLAAGRCDGFFELGLSPWDMAAGCLMIREAGGVVSDFGGGGEYVKTGNIVAGTPVTHPELLKEVRATFGGIIEQ